MTLRTQHEKPVYVRLRETIADAILMGKFVDGDPLPSVRALAAEEQANPLTVAKAYQGFQDEGLIVVKRGVGMFVEVGFQAGSPGSGSPALEELVVPSTAVQRVGERTVVFIPKEDEPGHFEVRDVSLGGEVEGYRRVLEGLTLGEKVVTKGSFTLKTQMMKGELGEHGH